MARGFRTLSVGLALTYLPLLATVAQATPECRAHGDTLAYNNTQVLAWMSSTANAYRDRAHIIGQLVEIYEDRNGHNHFSVQIGSRREETIEVVYSQDFGGLPELSRGMRIEACGDYITSYESDGRYPASPDGALVHWVHRSDTARHDSGFVAVDGVVYGW